MSWMDSSVALQLDSRRKLTRLQFDWRIVRRFQARPFVPLDEAGT
jgi:hypothetical protein